MHVMSKCRGAMKPTSAGEKWAHVSCALWIPEVSIGCPEKMEPVVTKISQIPASRWALICTLCRERVGACIQCSVKQCKTAYHVTCAFENGLEMEMKTTAIDSSEEGVKMQSFCNKHSSKDAETEVDEHNARLQKIRSLEAQFHKYVNVKDTVDLHNIDRDVVDFINYYWVLRRRAKFNKPLLITKCDEANLLIKQHENRLYSRLKMFVHLRQDLERVRNLCYMVSKREKIKEEVLKSRVGEQLFEKIYCSDPVEDAKEEKTNKNSLPKPPNPYAKSYINSMHTRSRRRTTSQNMAESGNEHCESENNEMPTLVKCKSEENLSSNDTKNKQETPSFTHSPFVIKIESKKDDKEQNSSVVKQEVETLNEEKNVTEKKDSPERDQSKKPEQLCDLDMSKISSENLTVKTKKLICENETSNDKNSLCLSDKENINALNPIKIKKTRSQTDSRHPELKNNIHELSNPKLELFDDENSLNSTPDLNSPERRNFRLDRRSTRYQMRSRRCSSDVLEHDELPSKSIELVEAQIALSSPIINSHSPSSNNIEKLTLVPEINSRTDESSPSDNSPVLTPKRGRVGLVKLCNQK
ncbi:protein Jade-3 [Caerostris extrusa]|uniref:Protein Jade-3 n=1 Tax=Caerostris extrusa TaxID=172846 RepID=A0AAV4T3U1_CAEEX|nr:protein Jade-3 [Caerostris extrusa]